MRTVSNPHPLDLLVHDLGTDSACIEHNDLVMTREGRPALELKPESFHPIPDTDTPAKVAFVDGGNGTITETPNFVISLNRLYCGMFQGALRCGAPTQSRIEFFSLVTRRVESNGEEYKTKYTAKLFPHIEPHRRYLPDEHDVASSIRESLGRDDASVHSLPRSLGEWRMASAAVNTMNDGDILVMDGSLTTLDRVESKYAKDLYNAAQERGVTVCALAKTSRLLTRGGEPLLDRAHEISRQTGLATWRIDVAEQISSHDQGFVMAVKLHPNAALPFRFEILREQYHAMSDAEKHHILSSLAANSQDVSFLGYPYGLVDADRYAQVRKADVSMYKALLQSRLRTSGELSQMLHSIRAYGAHDYLNGVTS